MEKEQYDNLILEYYDWLRFTRGLRDRSIETYKAAIDQLQVTYPITAGSIVGNLRAFFRERVSQKTATLSNRKTAFGEFFKWINRNGAGEVAQAALNALEDLRFPKNYREPKALSEDAILKWFFNIDRHRWKGLQLRAAFAVMYCGLRIGATCDLKKEDINFLEREIHVRNGKGGKERFKKFPPFIARVLYDYWEVLVKAYPDTPWLFPSIQGKRMCEHVLGRRLQREAQAAGLGHITSHILKRSFITHMAARGASPYALKNMGDWESIATSKSYVDEEQILADRLIEEKHPLAQAPGQTRLLDKNI